MGWVFSPPPCPLCILHSIYVYLHARKKKFNIWATHKKTRIRHKSRLPYPCFSTTCCSFHYYFKIRGRPLPYPNIATPSLTCAPCVPCLGARPNACFSTCHPLVRQSEFYKRKTDPKLTSHGRDSLNAALSILVPA